MSTDPMLDRPATAESFPGQIVQITESQEALASVAPAVWVLRLCALLDPVNLDPNAEPVELLPEGLLRAQLSELSGLFLKEQVGREELESVRNALQLHHYRAWSKAAKLGMKVGDEDLLCALYDGYLSVKQYRSLSGHQPNGKVAGFVQNIQTEPRETQGPQEYQYFPFELPETETPTMRALGTIAGIFPGRNTHVELAEHFYSQYLGRDTPDAIERLQTGLGYLKNIRENYIYYLISNDVPIPPELITQETNMVGTLSLNMAGQLIKQVSLPPGRTGFQLG